MISKYHVDCDGRLNIGTWMGRFYPTSPLTIHVKKSFYQRSLGYIKGMEMLVQQCKDKHEIWAYKTSFYAFCYDNLDDIEFV